MKFFVDTADIAELKKLNDYGMVDGVTTNPSIIAKSGGDFKETIKEICSFIKGPVSAEVVATEAAQMIAEGHQLAKIAPNVTVKLPLTWEGLKACRVFSNEGIMTNVTLCFSPAQALLAAKAGATFISPFVGRLDDIGHPGMALIADIKRIYMNYRFDTQILVASVRHMNHVLDAAAIGADVATLPPSVIWSLAKHTLTDKGLESFMADWNKSGQKI